MRAAKGLIQRAIIQSGGGGTQPSAEQSRDFSRRLISALGNPDIAGATSDLKQLVEEANPPGLLTRLLRLV